MNLDEFMVPIRNDVVPVSIEVGDVGVLMHIKSMSEADWQAASIYFVSGSAEHTAKAFPFAIAKSLCNEDGTQLREDGKTPLITQEQASRLLPEVLWGLWMAIKKLHEDPKG